MNYLKRSLNSKKIAYVVGGLGLIGLEVSKALNDSGAKVVIIDVKPINKKFKLYRFVNNNDIVPRVPFAFMWYKHAGQLHYINTYGKIRNASAWQRIKDRFRGYKAAFRKRQWFDSIYDHGMPNYVERIKKQKDGMIIL